MRQLLEGKFGDCKYKAISDCSGSYEHISDNTFFVYDPPTELNRPAKIVSREDEYQLQVHNHQSSDICFVKTDKCLFTDAVSKCDCILFGNGKFFFVEIKNSTKNTRRIQRTKAIEQLGATISLFKENGISLDGLYTKAIVCFKSNGDYPIQASKKTQQAIFLEKFNISLEEGNKIEF